MLSRQSNRRQSALSGEGEETIIWKQDTITRRYKPSAEAQNPVRLAFISWLLVVIGIMAAGLSSLSCAPNGYSGPVEPIIVAYSPFESTALIWIAEDQKFFNQNGLEVTLRKYDSGAGSLNGVLNGEADITLGVTEFPMVRRAFEKSEVRIIAAVAKSEQLYLVGRKDRGIEKMSDLKGKRIGTTFGTIAEFYLGRFLELNGMSIRDITVVDLKTPAEWENAVAEGVVDAIVTAQPYADLAASHLSDNAIVWPAQGNQYIYGLVVSSAEWVTKHTDIAGKFLKALAQAEEFASGNPAEAKAIVQKGLNLDASFVESAWSRDQFALSLDQSLITAMEDQARWIISNNLTAEKQVPNFLDYIDETALKAIKPGAVSIIR